MEARNLSGCSCRVGSMDNVTVVMTIYAIVLTLHFLDSFIYDM